mgnify:CR=1 FL=1
MEANKVWNDCYCHPAGNWPLYRPLTDSFFTICLKHCHVLCPVVAWQHCILTYNITTLVLQYQSAYIRIGIYSDQSFKFFAPINERINLLNIPKTGKLQPGNDTELFCKFEFTDFVKSVNATTKTTVKGANNKLSDTTFMLSQWFIKAKTLSASLIIIHRHWYQIECHHWWQRKYM